MGLGQKILIICEESRRAHQLETLFKAHHYETLTTHAGAAALEKYHAWPAELIVSDFHLHDMKEMELVDAVRRLNQRARFIMLIPPDAEREVGQLTPNRVIAYLRNDCPDEELLTHVRRGFGAGENFYNRRNYSRFKLSIDTSCVLINPFNNSESRPIAGLIRDVSRSGLSMLVRQVIPVPAMLKLILELPQTRQSITMLGKSLSCTLTQIPNVYRLGAKFVGLLPPEMEEAIGELNDAPPSERTDIFMGKTFKQAVEEWLAQHQDGLGDHGIEPGTPLPRVADDVCTTPVQHDVV